MSKFDINDTVIITNINGDTRIVDDNETVMIGSVGYITAIELDSRDPLHTLEIIKTNVDDEHRWYCVEFYENELMVFRKDKLDLI